MVLRSSDLSIRFMIFCAFFVILDPYNFLENNRNIYVACILILFVVTYFSKILSGKINYRFLPFLILFMYSIFGMIYNTTGDSESGLNTLLVNTFIIGAIGSISSRKNFSEICKIIYVMAYVLAIVSVIYNGFLQAYYMTHERIFLLSFILANDIIRKNYKALFFSCFLFILVIYLDPRTTSVIIFSLTFGLSLLFRLFDFKNVGKLILTIGLFSYMLNSIASQYILSLNSRFKESVQATDNSDFRLSMIQIGTNEFANSPFFGSMFSKGGSYSLDFNVLLSNGTLASSLPLHNDYLEVLVSGGAFGFILWSICISIPIISIMWSRIRITSSDGPYLAALLITTISACIDMAFNPVLNSVRSGSIFSIIFGMLLAGSSLKKDDR